MPGDHRNGSALLGEVSLPEGLTQKPRRSAAHCSGKNTGFKIRGSGTLPDFLGDLELCDPLRVYTVQLTMLDEIIGSHTEGSEPAGRIFKIQILKPCPRENE